MNLNHKKSKRAFTLIELLAVIAIIGIIAAMVVNLAAPASVAKRKQRVSVERSKLELAIDNYKSKFGFYPKDNAKLTAVGLTTADYERYSQINPLLYELTGGTNMNVNAANANVYFAAFNGSNIDAKTEMSPTFGNFIIANDPPQPCLSPLPQPNAYMAYPGWLTGAPGIRDIQGLTVPVETVQRLDDGSGNNLTRTTVTNFWHYDSSSTNRHNLSSYDLWAEFVIGKDKTGAYIYVTNGNW